MDEQIVEIYGEKFVFDGKACNRWTMVFAGIAVLLFIALMVP